MKWATDKGKEERKERNQRRASSYAYLALQAYCASDLLFNCLTVLLSGRCDRTEGTRWLQKSIVKRL
jgi:hypothetical protein